MHNEELPEGGFLSGEGPAEDRPDRDPLAAVQAVAEPRQAEESGVDAPGEGGDLPEYGEFEWPEGYVADPAAMAKFVPVARRLGLAKEGAQELARVYAELDRERHQAQARFIARNNDEWLRDIQGHPEFGGQNLERTSQGVASMLRRYGTPLLTAQIRQMNVQNWPEMFYFLARVSQTVTEDCSPPSQGGEAPAKSTAQLLFPGLK